MFPDALENSICHVTECVEKCSYKAAQSLQFLITCYDYQSLHTRTYKTTKAAKQKFPFEFPSCPVPSVQLRSVRAGISIENAISVRYFPTSLHMLFEGVKRGGKIGAFLY